VPSCELMRVTGANVSPKSTPGCCEYALRDESDLSSFQGSVTVILISKYKATPDYFAILGTINDLLRFIFDDRVLQFYDREPLLRVWTLQRLFDRNLRQVSKIRVLIGKCRIVVMLSGSPSGSRSYYLWSSSASFGQARDVVSSPLIVSFCRERRFRTRTCLLTRPMKCRVYFRYERRPRDRAHSGVPSADAMIRALRAFTLSAVALHSEFTSRK